MSQIYFSKQDSAEKLSRLSLLGSSNGKITVWLKGSTDKFVCTAVAFDKERIELLLDGKDMFFSPGVTVLCTFDLRGSSFFSEVTFQTSISGHSVLQFKNTLFKSERRLSFRLLTYPLYEIWADFVLDESQENAKIINIKSKASQTGLFKNFLNMVSNNSGPETHKHGNKLKIRVHDLSTTGMALQVGELEAQYFKKGSIFYKMDLIFSDETIEIPEVKVIYLVNQSSGDRNLKVYKVGMQFNNLPTKLDSLLGRKINRLLRENDLNKDFEDFIK